MLVLTHDQLVRVLRALLGGVESGDTLEGSLRFLLSAEQEGCWDVEASYRAGNLQGQGGMVRL